ncbi:MAG: hypothetical protein K2Y37_20370 [Pirellulales bacterium]|nr:hypothetical protein [Pirellulales bacterium]
MNSDPVAPLDVAPTSPSPASAAPTPFELACLCGAILRTTQAAEEAVCPVCGSRIPASRQLAPAGSRVAVSRDRPTARQPEDDRECGRSESAKDAPRRFPRSRLGWKPSRHRTVWLLLAACAIVVAATWQFERKRRAEIRLNDALAAGQQALTDARFDEAASLLHAAADAARIAGPAAPQAAAARALELEAHVWNRLSVRTLDDFFVEHGPDGGAEQRRVFEREFAGRTLVFDGVVEPIVDPANYGPDAAFGVPRSGEGNVPDGLAPGAANVAAVPGPLPSDASGTAERPANRWRLDWQVAGEGYAVELATEGLVIFDDLPRGNGVRGIFGGAIGRLEQVAGAPGKWRLHLVPGSCVLLTVPGPLESFHWPDDGWREVLATQKKLRDGLAAVPDKMEQP